MFKSAIRPPRRKPDLPDNDEVLAVLMTGGLFFATIIIVGLLQQFGVLGTL